MLKLFLAPQGSLLKRCWSRIFESFTSFKRYAFFFLFLVPLLKNGQCVFLKLLTSELLPSSFKCLVSFITFKLGSSCWLYFAQVDITITYPHVHGIQVTACTFSPLIIFVSHKHKSGPVGILIRYRVWFIS